MNISRKQVLIGIGVAAAVAIVAIGSVLLANALSKDELTFGGSPVRNAQEFLDVTETAVKEKGQSFGAVPAADYGCFYQSLAGPQGESTVEVKDSDVAPTVSCGPFLHTGQTTPAPKWVGVTFTGEVQADQPDAGYFFSSEVGDESDSLYRSLFQASDDDAFYSENASLFTTTSPSSPVRPDDKKPSVDGFQMRTGSAVIMNWSPRLDYKAPIDPTFVGRSFKVTSNGAAEVEMLSDGTESIRASAGKLLVVSMSTAISPANDETASLEVDGKKVDLQQARNGNKASTYVIATNDAAGVVLTLESGGKTFSYKLLEGQRDGREPASLRTANASGVGATTDTVVGVPQNGNPEPDTRTVRWEATVFTQAYDSDQGWPPDNSRWLQVTLSNDLRSLNGSQFRGEISRTSLSANGSVVGEVTNGKAIAIPVDADEVTISVDVNYRQLNTACFYLLSQCSDEEKSASDETSTIEMVVPLTARPS